MHNHQHRYQPAKQVTLAAIFVNIILSFFKIFFGIIGFSQGLLADGIHNLPDILIDIMVLIATKIGSQGPDAKHPYGHERIETMFTTILAIILVLVGLGIIYDAVQHLLVYHAYMPPSFITLIIAAVSVVINEVLYHWTAYVSKKIQSNLLRANAWHRRSDALASLVVVVGISGNLMGLHALDSIAAIVVALLIIKMGWEMFLPSFQEITDSAADAPLLKKMQAAACDIPGVLSLHQLRTRSSGGHIFADLHIQVSPYISVTEGHYIADQTTETLMKNFPDIKDLVVHIDPENDEHTAIDSNLPNRPTLRQALRENAGKLPLYDAIQRMNLEYLNHQVDMSLFFPLFSLSDISDPKQLQAAYQNVAERLPHVRNIHLYWGQQGCPIKPDVIPEKAGI